jgi:gamma-glutamyltranspeptidase
VDGVRAAGGIWTLEDLAQYRVVEREPVVVGHYRGWRVVSAAPPSSGGYCWLPCSTCSPASTLPRSWRAPGRTCWWR